MSLSRLCRNCKHWGAVKYPSVFSQDGMKDCDHLTASRYTETDGEPYTVATIGTAPDFGCVLFEEKV